MPGRNYNQAYAQLEQSLSRSDTPENAQDIFGSNLLQPIRSLSYATSKPSSLRDFGSGNGYGSKPSFRDRLPDHQVPQRASSLNYAAPSTRPDPRLSLSKPLRSHPIHSTESSGNSGSRIVPVNLGADRAQYRSDLSPGPSPCAESFATALENQRFGSVSGSAIDLPLDGVDDEYMSHSCRHGEYFGLKNMGWGIENVGPEHDPGINAIELDPSDVPFFEAFNREWNSGRLHAKSGHKKRKASARSGMTFLEDRESDEVQIASDDTMPESPSPGSSWLNTASLERMSEEMTRRSTPTSPDDVPNNANLTSQKNSSSPPYRSSSHNTKPLSNDSSNTIEATVVDMSPRSNRTLRRKEKTDMLRDKVENNHGLGVEFDLRDNLGDELSRSQMQTPGLTFSSADRESRNSRDSSPDPVIKMRDMLPFDKPRPTKSLVSKLPSSTRQISHSQPQRSMTVGCSSGKDHRVRQAKRLLFDWQNDMDGTADDLLGSAPQLALQVPVAAFDETRRPSPRDRIHTPPAVQQYTRELLGPPRFSIPSYQSGRRHSPGVSIDESVPRFSVDSSRPEVIQATAVSIHPHGNTSLLVVQHPATLAEPQSISAQSKISEEVYPTPPRQARANNDHVDLLDPNRPITIVDSPLQNPRRPPDPPTLSITPATPITAAPQSEVTPEQVVVSAVPSRRRAIMKTARRFSDSILEPMKHATSRGIPRDVAQQSARHPPESSAPLAMPTSSDTAETTRTRPQMEANTSEGLTEDKRHKLRAVNPDVGVSDEDEQIASAEDSAPAVRDQELHTEQATPSSPNTPLVDIGPTDEPLTPASQSTAKHNFPPSAAKTGSLRHASVLRKFFRRDDPAAGELPPTTKPTRTSSLREAVRRPGTARSNSFTTNLTRSLSERLKMRMSERNERREEKERNERQEKVRNSIGPRFYVDSNDTGYGTGLPERPHQSVDEAVAA